MANQWLRLWHDMPNDPKWRTISRISGQPIALVIAVYVHLLVDASRNVTRGHVDVTTEDLASALDVTESEIDAILQAMQTRVMDEKRLSGWGSRQVKHEDSVGSESGAMSAAERKRAERKRKKDALESGACHEMSRHVTTDKDKDTELTSTDVEVVVSESLPTCPHQEIIALFGELLPELPQPRVWEGNRRDHLASRWKWVIADLRKKGMPADRQAGIDFFRRMFEYIGKRDRLMGRDGGWSCSLPWIVKAENFAKIIEGNYEKTKGAA